MNPYSKNPDYTFWKRAVVAPGRDAVDPVTKVPFVLSTTDKVATAGSCFAQHIARTLVKRGFNYFVVENKPHKESLPNENYGTFTARFGNLYTVRQLLQLFDRAYSVFKPKVGVWKRADGKFVDPFRPQIQNEGYESQEELLEDQKTHLKAVRTMFEECDVFIFTLGLTEAWVSKLDGAVVPSAPGVVGVEDENFEFKNFNVLEIYQDISSFIEKIRMVNPAVRIILTVSPVPLIATYVDRHVLLSNTYSKSALRVVAEMVVEKEPMIAYFPSFEIITGHHARYGYYEDDLRGIREEGVSNVMQIFSKHYLSGDLTKPSAQQAVSPPSAQPVGKVNRSMAASFNEISEIICDEEAIDRDDDKDNG